MILTIGLQRGLISIEQFGRKDGQPYAGTDRLEEDLSFREETNVSGKISTIFR